MIPDSFDGWYAAELNVSTGSRHIQRVEKLFWETMLLGNQQAFLTGKQSPWVVVGFAKTIEQAGAMLDRLQARKDDAAQNKKRKTQQKRKNSN